MLSVILSLVVLPTICTASGSAKVYLHPPLSSSVESVGPGLLAHHLGLEVFEDSHGEVVLGGASAFVGKGRRDTLLVSIDANYHDDVVPRSLQPSFTLSTSSSSLSPLLTRYTSLARQTYHSVADSSAELASQPSVKFLDIFSLSASTSPAKSDALESFLLSLGSVVAFLEETQAHNDGERFGAFEVKGLNGIEEAWGRDSEQYITAASTLKATIQSAMLDDLSLALLMPSHLNARQIVQPPQSPFPSPKIPDTAPVFSTSTCFTTADRCGNATASCSSRGKCVGVTRAGRTCYVCQCGKAPLEEGGKNISWAGEMCQKKDISQQFTLIVGTVIFLILMTIGSISLLYTIGYQELPGTLTGGLGGHPKHD